MAAITKIKYNPATGEIEIEGSEAFVKKYFEKLQGKPAIEQPKVESQEKPKKTRRRGRPKGTVKTAVKTEKKKTAAKSSMTSTIMQLVQKNSSGITVADLAKKTGIEIQPLSNILWRLKKEGKIGNPGRGLYAPA